ncbi:MAG: hypothetical protein L6R38_006378, partial [Xanthoria sp. 2 TBL-2021]
MVTRTPGAGTIPTSPGFTPAASQVQNTATALKFARRELEVRAPTYRTRCIGGPEGKPTFTPQLYPTQVLCGALYQVIATTTKTLTASATATVTGNPPPPSLTITTVSLTITSNVVPVDASTTTTVLSNFINVGTSLSFTVTIATITSTQTVDGPQPTVYAACGQDNLLTSVNGENIVGFASNNALSRILNFSNPYNCSVACITSPNCAAGILFRDEATCYLVAQTGMTSDPKVEVLRFFTES